LTGFGDWRFLWREIFLAIFSPIVPELLKRFETKSTFWDEYFLKK
jgi:hypothetical protein